LPMNRQVTKDGKIAVREPVVEIDGDESTRGVWHSIKEKLIVPYVDMPIKYFDCALQNRIDTEDQVTVDAAAAVKECGVGIKCSTMEMDEDLIQAKGLVKMWKSATVFDRERSLRSAASTLRGLLEGANFRTPIRTNVIKQTVPGWTKPIVVARHVFADQYRATDVRVEEKSQYKITITPDDPQKAKSYDVHEYTGKGVAMAMYNSVDKIESFAKACFEYALKIKYPVYLSTKYLMLKDYDGAFVRTFNEVYTSSYASAFEKLGLWYEHKEIDDMVGFVLRSDGGFIWACKNYDGDIQSEMVAQGFGSAELMSSVLLSPDGKVMFCESLRPATVGGTSTSQGKTAINPVSCIYAWVHGLEHRAKLDDNHDLKTFAECLEKSCLETIEKGNMTKDMMVAGKADAKHQTYLNSEELVEAISKTLKDMMLRGAKIMYTLTDEAPMLATYALLPIIKSFTKKSGIEVELRDISVAGRVLALFPDRLPKDKLKPDELTALGELAKTPVANVIKLPNVSASIPQLKECIAELQAHGYNVPDFPEVPQNAEEKDIKARYAKVLGSAVNPVLREGNSDRRAAVPVKEYAKKHPHSMGKWSSESKTHVAHMSEGDFYASEKSCVIDTSCDVRIELVKDGTATILKPSTPLLPGEVIDASFMSKKHLRAFLEKEIDDCLAKGVLCSLHLKATMMKVSDPIMFGHMVKVFFKDVFEKHASTIERLGVIPNNGFGDLLKKIKSLEPAERALIEADIEAVYAKRPKLAMVDSDAGITNLHVPSDVIIDASMPAMIRASGQMWCPDSAPMARDSHLCDCKAIIPDRCYAGVFAEAIESCKKNGAFDPATMGTVPNVGLMAQKAEEYGSHDKTFEIKSSGKVRVVNNQSGSVLLEHEVEEGDIWRMCQTKDIPIQDWVKLAVSRARATGAKAIFWLDQARAHDGIMIQKVNQYLKNHDTTGLDIEIMKPVDACRVSCDRARKGLDTISVTGNVLRDYNTDLFPILELGTSAKMLSIVPLLAGGGMYETGAGGSAPKHVQQFQKENHLRWDSLGEYLALAVSLEDLATMTKNPKAKVLAEALNKANGKFLDANKNPSRKVKQIDNRGSHFYLALYWAQALAEQCENAELKSQFTRMAAELENNEQLIIDELIKCQGPSVDIGGYYDPDPVKVEKAMRPSAIFNAILTLGANW